MTANEIFSSPSSERSGSNGYLLPDYYCKLKTWIRSEIVNNCLIRIWQYILTTTVSGCELTTELIVQLRFPMLYLKPVYLISYHLPFYTAGFCSQNRGRHWKWRRSNHD